MLPPNLQTLRDKKSNWSLAEDRQVRRNFFRGILGRLIFKLNQPI